MKLDARPGASNNAELQLAVASLADWLPDAGGRLVGHFTVRGKATALSVNGNLDGSTLSYQQQKIDQLHLVVGVPDLGHPGGKLVLNTRGVLAGGLAFRTIDLHAEGSQASHRLTLDARGDQLSAALALDGTMKNDRWNGTLGTLRAGAAGHAAMAPADIPARLSYAPTARCRCPSCASPRAIRCSAWPPARTRRAISMPVIACTTCRWHW